MTSLLDYSQIAPEEERRLGYILEQCFTMSPGESKVFFERIGLENFRVIRRDEQIVGGLATIPMGQWWGGERVPMTGIGGVGIAVEHRGTGAALSLMQSNVKELYAKGVAISALYPAIQRLYRKVGYEQGGSYCGWEIPTESIQVKEQPLPITPVSTDYKFNELYDNQAKLTNGYLDRHQGLWKQLIRPEENEAVYAYLIGSLDQPQGYIIFSQHRAENSTFIRIRDWVVLTTAAAQTLWCFLSNQRSVIDMVRWKSSPIDLLTLLLPEQNVKQRFVDRWMLRVVNVVKALEKRGYPPDIQAQLHLTVEDELVAQNNGNFILSVANGRGEVSKGGKGELKLEIKGLAPLYTGLFTPHQLQLMGKLEATQTALLAATQIFAGFSPWMADFF
ncbi:GNAT family N-acetyltransferase [Iningainema tapete]|uniref:GNAT family N-acetyltransferase n=1 Tax=Iningainema tapete BLCC-T55 TaxID=2748662 RepID=A0A8J7C0I5_9CYAN|nr:GNAT family N-acetyltransferase [Iningainema tapete]MBD2778083.1 GNAT family N-acetyltransferase [Iningainema tapete BLCC-T55]